MIPSNFLFCNWIIILVSTYLFGFGFVVVAPIMFNIKSDKNVPYQTDDEENSCHLARQFINEVYFVDSARRARQYDSFRCYKFSLNVVYPSFRMISGCLSATFSIVHELSHFDVY